MTTEPTEQVGTRLMFENAQVRVWDLALAPGESLEKHIHRVTYCFVVEAGGLIRFADPDDPTDSQDVQFTADEVVWVAVGAAGKIDNRLPNIGTTRHRNDVVKFKPGECRRPGQDLPLIARRSSRWSGSCSRSCLSS